MIPEIVSQVAHQTVTLHGTVCQLRSLGLVNGLHHCIFSLTDGGERKFYVYTSPDEETWTQHYVGALTIGAQVDTGGVMQSLAFGAGLYVLLGQTLYFPGVPDNPHYFTSPDLVTWTLRSSLPVSSFGHQNVVHTGTRFVATTQVENFSSTSVDGLAWTKSSVGVFMFAGDLKRQFGTIAFGGYAYVWGDNHIFRTSDGVTWSLFGYGYQLVKHNGALWGMIANTFFPSDVQLMSSTDGLTLNIHTSVFGAMGVATQQYYMCFNADASKIVIVSKPDGGDTQLTVIDNDARIGTTFDTIVLDAAPDPAFPFLGSLSREMEDMVLSYDAVGNLKVTVDLSNPARMLTSYPLLPEFVDGSEYDGLYLDVDFILNRWFVFFQEYYSETTYVSTSRSARSWEVQTLPDYVSYKTRGPSRGAANVFAAGSGDVIYYTRNGSDWITGSITGATGSDYFDNIEFFNGLYIAPSYGTNRMFTSPDLENWTLVTLPITMDWSALWIMGSTLLIIPWPGGGGTHYLRTTDLTSFTQHEMPADIDLYGGYCYDGVTLVSGSNDGPGIRTSDGIAWEPNGSYRSTAAISSPVLIDGTIYAIASPSFPDQSFIGHIIKSIDGGNSWTPYSALDKQLSLIRADNSKFVGSRYFSSNSLEAIPAAYVSPVVGSFWTGFINSGEA